MEPERKIEKLLRTYAEKRRRQSGDPLELHPATRRLLQGEAARQAPKPKGSRLAAIFHALRPGWAFALPVVIIGVGIALLIPVLRSQKESTRMAKQDSVNEELARKTAAPGTPLPAATAPAEAAPLLKRMQTEEASKQVAVELAQDQNRPQPATLSLGASAEGASSSVAPATAATTPSFDSVSQRAWAATPPSTPATRAKDAALADDASASTLSLQTGQRVEAGEGADASRTAAVPRSFGGGGAGGGGARGGRDMSSTAPNQTIFYRLSNVESMGVDAFKVESEPATSRERLNAQAAGVISNAMSVLSSFAVEQRGADLRIVDSDGSLYTGNLGFVASNRAVPAARAPVRSARSDERYADTVAGPQQSFSFRVTGTNRSLRQAVTFSGELMTITNALSSDSRFGVAAANQPASAPGGFPQMILSNSVINGTAVIGGREALMIQAAPANSPAQR